MERHFGDVLGAVKEEAKVVGDSDPCDDGRKTSSPNKITSRNIRRSQQNKRGYTVWAHVIIGDQLKLKPIFPASKTSNRNMELGQALLL